MGRNSSIIPTSLLLLLILAIPQISDAQDTPRDFLDAHDIARSEVDVGPLSWDDSLASYALNYLSHFTGRCKVVHSDSPFGENLARSWGYLELTGTAAVNMWVREKPNYDNDSNSCIGGECRHYTQVVWRDSILLSCAKSSATIIIMGFLLPANITLVGIFMASVLI